MSYLKKFIDDTPQFADPTVIPNFLDNHDVARYFDSNPGAAKSSNAIVGNFLISGIPIIYYGTEREMKGSGDPFNRATLWSNGGYSTTGATFGLIKKLNGIRNGLGNGTRFHTEIGKVIGNSDNDIAILRNNVLVVLTKVCPFLELVWKELMGSEVKVDRELGKSKILLMPQTPRSSSMSILDLNVSCGS
jgi:alpha-amylase